MNRPRRKRYIYTDEDIDYIEEWYGRKTLSEIAQHLNKDIDRLKAFIERHHITKIIFSLGDDEYIINHYRTTPYKDMAIHLDKSCHQVQVRVLKLVKMYHLPLKKPRSV